MRHPLVAILALLLFALPAAAAPRVAVSIKPIDALVAGVMAGVGTPALLVEGAGSPHSYALRPSEAHALAEAQVVFWVGPQLESFLNEPLARLARNATVVTLTKTPGITLLPARRGGLWEPETDAGPGSGHGDVNPHIWLDPANAKAIVAVAVRTLSAADPADAVRFRANGKALDQRLDRLDRELRRQLAPLKGIPFLVFHDAYRYLEQRYDLDAVGSVTVSPDRRPGVRRILQIREKIRHAGVRCVFSEPQFEPRLISTLIEGTKARSGVLDPLGVDLPAAPTAYFTLMHRLADSLQSCLAPAAGAATPGRGNAPRRH